MKKIFISSFVLIASLNIFAANEKKNLAILMMNGSVKMVSLDEKLQGKLLGEQLADAMHAQGKRKTVIENKCDDARKVENELSHEVMVFEDCELTIKKKKQDSVAIQYQIRTKIKNGKSKSILRKRMLRAGFV